MTSNDIGYTTFVQDAATQRIFVSGLASGAAGSTGGTDDFWVAFDVNRNDPAGPTIKAVQGLQIPFTMSNSNAGGANIGAWNGDVTVTYKGVATAGTVPAVPLPAGLPLLAAGLGLVAMLRRQKA